MQFFATIVLAFTCASAAALPLEARDNISITCGDSNIHISTTDISAAIGNLQNTLNSNPKFSDEVAAESGSAIAYGCDYGNGQNRSGNDMASDLQKVIDQCGQGVAGWLSHPDWKASYGITAVGTGYCH